MARGEADHLTARFEQLFGPGRGRPPRDDALVCERAELLCFYFNLIAENNSIPTGEEEATLRAAMHIGALHLRRLDPASMMPLRFAAYLRPVDELAQPPACDLLIERDAAAEPPFAWMRPYRDDAAT